MHRLLHALAIFVMCFKQVGQFCCLFRFISQEELKCGGSCVESPRGIQTRPQAKTHMVCLNQSIHAGELF
ncbi:MAG: hypothetical protein ACK56I_16570, partial [bacterium]